jgi:hypothetical protein
MQKNVPKVFGMNSASRCLKSRLSDRNEQTTPFPLTNWSTLNNANYSEETFDQAFTNSNNLIPNFLKIKALKKDRKRR